MRQMQEQFVAMYRKYGMVKQGFRNAKLLVLRLINTMSAANGRHKCRHVVPGAFRLSRQTISF